ncbi:MAG: HupE/UreJ family protein [Gammaproteobacteria bacterium]
MRWGILCLFVLCTGMAQAHRMAPVTTDVQFQPGGRFTLELTLNLEAALAGIGPKHADTDDSPQAETYNRLRALPPDQLDAALADALPRLMSALDARIDDRPVALEYRGSRIPEVGDTDLARKSRVIFDAAVPSGASAFTFALDPGYGQCILRIRAGEDSALASHWLKDGSPSPPYILQSAYRTPGVWTTVGEYIVLGFDHIVPLGVDHILFVVGLFLLTLKMRPLLWQVTAFTVAHTITLALSMTGHINLPTHIVEPLIALSIAYIGVENLLVRKVHWHRVVVIFLFGLLHGMGFAGVLTQIGLPPGQFLTALIAFNVGVEFGQLAVLAVAFAAVGYWYRDHPKYHLMIVTPISLAISATGFYWVWERI